MTKPIAEHDLPEELYPLEIEIYGKNDELLWSKRIEKPDPGHKRLIGIPGFGPGGAPRIVFRFGDGTVHEEFYRG